VDATKKSEEIDQHRRRFFATAAMGIAAAGAFSLLPARLRAAAEDNAIRPFRVNVPEEQLVDLRRRIAATRWPDKETVTDVAGRAARDDQKLARYWATGHDWRKVEARLNALPQFMTEIDGLDIHFIHVRSKHENALPLIVTHGWPGSIIEQLKIIDPLTNPTAHGASASDAFDIVIPSLPGYGFSGKPTATGWDIPRIARTWVTLMKRLGYTRFVAAGGDVGAQVVDELGVQAPPELLGIHTNMPGTVPADISKALNFHEPAPAGLSAEERNAWDQLDFFYKKGLGYATEMSLRPQTLYGLADSPVGLAAWMLDHDDRSYKLIARVRRTNRRTHPRRRPRQHHALLVDEHGGVFGAFLLGLQRHGEEGLFRRQGRHRHPGGRERLSGRDLYRPAQLGRESVSQAHSLQQASQRRALRGVGAAAILFRGSSRGLVARSLRNSNGHSTITDRGGSRRRQP
jgi:pimeloyl-ACP methyl ester carboxylesterase